LYQVVNAPSGVTTALPPVIRKKTYGSPWPKVACIVCASSAQRAVAVQSP
jgi:hypothetical protein